VWVVREGTEMPRPQTHHTSKLGSTCWDVVVIVARVRALGGVCPPPPCQIASRMPVYVHNSTGGLGFLGLPIASVLALPLPN
jgi:hypothetical protein